MRARKIRYHREGAFRERLRGPAPVPELRVEAMAAPIFDLPTKPPESAEMKLLLNGLRRSPLCVIDLCDHAFSRATRRIRNPVQCERLRCG